MSEFPRIATVGFSGIAVTFASEMDDRANMAAIAFRAAVDAEGWPEVLETSSTLVSTFLSVDLATTDREHLTARLTALLATHDWYDAGLPPGRKLWTIPMVFGGDRAPQLQEAAQAAGLSETAARDSLANARTRVITIGYAPGQPYLGPLDPEWNIPRQSNLSPSVPAGALVVAIRQLVIFTATMPTGWRHVGQTAFRTFDPERATPIAFTPGDEIRFAAITEAELLELEKSTDSLGGATWEAMS